MLPIFFISLREFLEAFLIGGVFLGISRKLRLKKEKEIILAILIGVILTFVLCFFVYFYGDKARLVFNERNTELLEGYLMVFAGIFLAYVVFSLHRFFVFERSKKIIEAHQKMTEKIFDFSLFFTIFTIVFREGFEIALFTSATALFSQFFENIAGLFAGFFVAAVFTLLTFFSFIRFSIHKIYKATEYLIILLGAAFVKNGIKELLEVHFDFHLEKILSISFHFLPEKNTFIGHFLNNFFGLEKNFSFVYFLIIISYVYLVKKIFLMSNVKRLTSNV